MTFSSVNSDDLAGHLTGASGELGERSLLDEALVNQATTEYIKRPEINQNQFSQEFDFQVYKIQDLFFMLPVDTSDNDPSPLVSRPLTPGLTTSDPPLPSRSLPQQAHALRGHVAMGTGHHL